MPQRTRLIAEPLPALGGQPVDQRLRWRDLQTRQRHRLGRFDRLLPRTGDAHLQQRVGLQHAVVRVVALLGRELGRGDQRAVRPALGQRQLQHALDPRPPRRPETGIQGDGLRQ